MTDQAPQGRHEHRTHPLGNRPNQPQQLPPLEELASTPLRGLLHDHLSILGESPLPQTPTKPSVSSLSEENIIFSPLLVATLLNARSRSGAVNGRSFEQAWGKKQDIDLVRTAYDMTNTLLSGRSADDPLWRHLRNVANRYIAESSPFSHRETHEPIVSYQLNTEALRQGAFRSVFEPDAERREAIQEAGKRLGTMLSQHPALRAVHHDSPNPTRRTAASLLLFVGISVVRAVEQLSLPETFSDFLASESYDTLQLSGLYLPAARAILLNTFKHLRRSGIAMESLATELRDLIGSCYSMEKHYWKIPDVGTNYRIHNMKEWIDCGLNDVAVVESCVHAFMTELDLRNALDELSAISLESSESIAPSAFGAQILKELSSIAFYTYQEEDDPLFIGFLKTEVAAVRQVRAIDTRFPGDTMEGCISLALDENGDIASGIHFLDAPFLTAQDSHQPYILSITTDLERRLVALLERHSEVLLLNTGMNHVALIDYKGSLFLLSKTCTTEAEDILTSCGWGREDKPLGTEFQSLQLDELTHRYRLVENRNLDARTEAPESQTPHNVASTSKVTPTKGLDFDGFRKILLACGVEYDETTGGTHPNKFLFNGRKWPVSSRFRNWDAIFPNMLWQAARRLGLDMDRLRHSIALWERGEL